MNDLTQPAPASTPRSDYPRPHFDRSHSWQPCTGSWDFWADADEDGEQRGLPLDRGEWPSTITVPFAWETQASGIAAHWLSCGWYRREVTIPDRWRAQRIILHFGAVHHGATVWINGRDVGTHEGGYTPFEYDITDLLTDGRGVIVVRVHAPLDKRDIAHGKQRSIPRDDYDGCSFTPSSGIWQPVWLEARPTAHIRSLQLRPGPELSSIHATIATAGVNDPAQVSVSLHGGAPVTAQIIDGTATVKLPIPSPRLWHPADPHLYFVTATLTCGEDTDTVTSYTGLRSITTEGGNLTLNGERLYLRGVLDQGYWPHTGITAPTGDAFVTDLQIARDFGFNLVRKHLKLEDPRFLFHADQLGLLVWAEPPSTGRFTPAAVDAFEAQIPAMVERDGNHPSIVIWGLYNEEWGLDWDVPADPAKQAAVQRAFTQLKRLDPSRPAVDNSGWAHVDTDLVDWHIYDETPAGWAAKIANLLGGHTDAFPVAIAPATIVQKQLMAIGGPPPPGLPNLNSEYGGGYTSVERGWNLRWQTQQLRRYDNLSGYVWTELTDIEHETAGLVTFDRTPRDSGGNNPAHTNADTILIVDITPVAPGVDLITDGPVHLDIHISHHGKHVVEGDLTTTWGPLLADAGPDQLMQSERVTGAAAKPFQLSAPYRLNSRLADHLTAARLTVALIRDSQIIATATIDVQRSTQPARRQAR